MDADIARFPTKPRFNSAAFNFLQKITGSNGVNLFLIDVSDSDYPYLPIVPSHYHHTIMRWNQHQSITSHDHPIVICIVTYHQQQRQE